MKILLVNKFHYIVGGSETYYFALKDLLEKKGHKVIEFSMKDEKNIPSKYEKYFVENVSYTDGSFVEKFRAGLKIIYSVEAKKKFELLIKKTKPDIIHLHLFQHQISPSILDVIKKYRIPTVYTAHELKMICPNYQMYCNGRICEKCKGKKYYNCTVNKCIKNSISKSALCTIESYFHLIKKSYECIDKIITPSEFYKNKFIEFGIPSENIVHIPNFLNRETPKYNLLDVNKKYYLYFGRLSKEKGINTLISAMDGIKIPLWIVGTGAEKEGILRRIDKENIKNITVLGFKSGQELIDIIANARTVILPSEWYENGPYSAIESLQVGRPLIVSRIGGIPELIDGNGYTFEPGNIADLHQMLDKMQTIDDEMFRSFERKSLEIYQKEYTPEIHYDRLMKVYQDAIQKKSKEGKNG